MTTTEPIAIVHRNRITTMIMILIIATATITMMVLATISGTMTKKMNYGNRLKKSESTLMKMSR